MDSEQIPSNQRRFGIFLTNSANLIAPQIFHIRKMIPDNWRDFFLFSMLSRRSDHKLLPASKLLLRERIKKPKKPGKKWVPGLLSYLLVSLKSFTVYPLKLQKIFYVYDSFTESIQPHFSLLLKKVG